MPADLAEFPEYMERVMAGIDFAMPACVGPVSYRGLEAVRPVGALHGRPRYQGVPPLIEHRRSRACPSPRVATALRLDAAATA